MTISNTNPPKRTNTYHAIALQILMKDIKKMDYEWNETPMCDPYSKNAICFAFDRVVRKGVGPTRIFCEGSEPFIRIRKSKFQLNQQLTKWFDQANRGLIVKPINTICWMPKNLIRQELVKTAFISNQLIY